MSEGRIVMVKNAGKTTVGTVMTMYETTRFAGIGLPDEPVWFIKVRVRPSEMEKAYGTSEVSVSNYYARNEWEYLD